MSNIISLNSDGICMSNGLTAVFIDVLALVGSRLAQTEDEKRLIVWLAEKDQSVVGIGTVGFDIREMPWNTERFEENKRFMLKVIEAAETGTDWNRLGYQPNEEMIFPALKKFSELISQMTADDVDKNAAKEWLGAAESDDPVLCGFPKCERHGALLSCFGCHACNN
ncbi:MAG: hypothetical protein K2N38_06950 [Oscillospiraceae bacterium]|nr:hypothetical protein [Oscillospiraceae bacterium]